MKYNTEAPRRTVAHPARRSNRPRLSAVEARPLDRRDWPPVANIFGLGMVFYEARAATLTGALLRRDEMSGPDLKPWSPSALFPLFLMWSEMMVATRPFGRSRI